MSRFIVLCLWFGLAGMLCWLYDKALNIHRGTD